MKLVNIHLLAVAATLFPFISPAHAQTWSLQQCIDTALTHNLSLQSGRTTIAISEYKHDEAVTALYPRITATSDYKYYTDLPYQLLPLSVFGGPAGQFKEAQFGVPHNINAGFQLSLPVYNPNTFAAIQITSAATELTSLQYRRSEEQVFFEITNLYYNAQLLIHQQEFIDSNLSNATRLLNTVKLLQQESLAKAADVSKIELQISQLTTQKLSVESRLEQVLNTLKFMMGIDPERSVQIDPAISLPQPANYNRHETIDLRLAKAGTFLLQSELRALKLSRLPSLSLYSAYGTMGFGYHKEPSFLNFHPYSFVGIQLSVTLFNGTTTTSKIRTKRAELVNNKIQIEMLTAQNNMQVLNTSLQLTVARATAETAKQEIIIAEAIYRETLLQQKHGLATLTDVLLADNTLRQAQQAYLNAIVEYLRADLELKKLTGNLTTGY
jgi:outer membrane protein TolC